MERPDHSEWAFHAISDRFEAQHYEVLIEFLRWSYRSIAASRVGNWVQDTYGL